MNISRESVLINLTVKYNANHDNITIIIITKESRVLVEGYLIGVRMLKTKKKNNDMRISIAFLFTNHSNILTAIVNV